MRDITPTLLLDAPPLGFDLECPANRLPMDIQGRIWPKGKVEPNFDVRLALPQSEWQCAHVEWSNKDNNYRRCLSDSTLDRANGWLCSKHQQSLIDRLYVNKGVKRDAEAEVVESIIRYEQAEFDYAYLNGLVVQHRLTAKGAILFEVAYPTDHPARQIVEVNLAEEG